MPLDPSPTPSAEQVIAQAYERSWANVQALNDRTGGRALYVASPDFASDMVEALAEAGFSLVETEELRLLEFGARHGANAIREFLVKEAELSRPTETNSTTTTPGLVKEGEQLTASDVDVLLTALDELYDKVRRLAGESDG